MHFGVPSGLPLAQKNWDDSSGHLIVQFFSSLPSAQSSLPSHFHLTGIQNEFWHLNWSFVHAGKLQSCSSEPSGNRQWCGKCEMKDATHVPVFTHLDSRSGDCTLTPSLCTFPSWHKRTGSAHKKLFCFGNSFRLGDRKYNCGLTLPQYKIFPNSLANYSYLSLNPHLTLTCS